MASPRKTLIGVIAGLAAALGGGLALSLPNACACAPPKPEAAAWPAVTGTPEVGQTLTTNNGGWVSQGNHTGENRNYAYQWKSCTSTTLASCSDATGSGATTNTYTVASGDAGNYLRAQVTATSSGGSTSQDSAPTAVGGPSIYGSAYQMDGLGNMQVGGTDCGCSNVAVGDKFVAATTSTLTSIRWYPVNEPGYAGGNGGSMRISVQSDSGGLPSGTILASATLGVGTIPDVPNLLTTFSSPAALTAGTTYHIVFENTDASPTTNYVSVDDTYKINIINPRQPKFTDAEWGAERKFGAGTWGTNNDQNYTPTLALTYGNGTTQGNSYLELSYIGQGGIGVISGNSAVRERFTVSGGQRTIQTAHIRLQRLTGTGTDPLTINLDDSGGTPIDTCTIPAASIVTAANTGGTDQVGGNATYVSCAFSSPHTLVNGNTYDIRLTTPGTTTYNLWVIRKGSASKSYPANTVFGDGYATQTTNNGSTWVSLGYAANENDIQFYLSYP